MEIKMSLIISKFTLFEASLQRIFPELWEDFLGFICWGSRQGLKREWEIHCEMMIIFTHYIQ